jgi:sec-independent protein translocase protein TatA
MLRGLEGWHIVILVGVVAVLFGSRRLPDAARSVGQSMRIFKSEMKAAHDEHDPAPPLQPVADPAPLHQLPTTPVASVVYQTDPATVTHAVPAPHEVTPTR